MRKNENGTVSPLRVDLYIRVSGQEQAIKGLSLEAQQEDLEEYARERGRLYINLRLSLAQNEADLCGEKIGVVLDSKVKHGTVVCGKIPFGYRINEEKHLEIVPQDAVIILDSFEHYRATVSLRATAAYIRQTYGLNWDNVRCRRNLCQTLYIGHYESNGRVNPNFFPPIVPLRLYNDVQKLLSNNTKANPTGRVFLFTSLLICAECGHRLAGIRNGDYCYYRCPQYYSRRTCNHKKQIREDAVEQWLFSFLGAELEKQRLEWEVKEIQRKRTAASVDRAGIRRKLSRLKELYINEIIDLEEYRRDYELYTVQLSECAAPRTEEERPNFDAVESILSKGFRSIYDGFSPEEKRTLWRSVIKEIHVDKERQITRIVFL